MAYKNKEDAREYDREYKKKYRKKNPTKNNQYQATYKRTRYASDPDYRAETLAHNKKQRTTAAYMVHSAKKRARMKNVPFTLGIVEVSHIQTVLDLGFCEVTGIAFERMEGERHHFAPSLHRIEPRLGYVPGNIQVIIWCLNAALGSWGEDVLLKLARAIVDRNG